MAAHAAVIIMTEDMIGVMMTGTITAGRTEEVVEEEADGELLKTGIKFTEGGHPLLNYSRGGYRSRSRLRSYSPRRY